MKFLICNKYYWLNFFIYFNSYFPLSLRGTHLYDEDGLDVFVEDRIQLGVSDISPIFRMTMDVVDGDLFKRLFGMDLPQLSHLGGVSKALSVLQMDAILRIWSRHQPRDPFRLMKAFEPIVWILLLAAIIFIFIPLVFRFKKHLFKILEFLFFCLFGCPELTFLKKIPGLLVLWATVVWLLQQYYGGDMLSAMMEPLRLAISDLTPPLWTTTTKATVTWTEIL